MYLKGRAYPSNTLLSYKSYLYITIHSAHIIAQSCLVSRSNSRYTVSFNNYQGVSI